MTFSRNAAGHLAALLTILIWGTTFISTGEKLRSSTLVEMKVVPQIRMVSSAARCPAAFRLNVMAWPPA